MTGNLRPGSVTQNDDDSAQAILAGVLRPVTIGVNPDAVSDGGRGHETKVNAFNGASLGRHTHLRDNGPIVDLSATLVGLRGHEASQVTRIGANDTDAVGPQSDSDELVAAILIGRGSQRLAILSGHRLSIRA